MRRNSRARPGDPLDDRVGRADLAILRLLGTAPAEGPKPGGCPRADRRISVARIGAALDTLHIRCLADGEGGLLAIWERHAMLFTVEGPRDEILVMRARPHATVPPERADRAYRAVNEWNHTRRFGKAYVGDPTRSGQLPVFAEVEVPLEAGVHETLLVELLGCGAAVAASLVEWLHGEGGLL